ncbi:MAG: PEGA domain-containing protein [bacterium]|nr:PEGA domain-containing protein [bacterium]
MSYKKIILILTIVGVVILGGYVFYKTVWINNIAGEAALAVNSVQGNTNVFVNDKLLGTTPFYSNAIKSGNVEVSIRNDDRTFDINLNLEPNTETILNRELGPNRDFGAGDTVWVERSKDTPSMSVISDPVGALVKLDGEVKGETPITINNIKVGEHDLEISKDGFETRTLRPDIKEGIKLNVDSKLFTKPVGRPLAQLKISTPTVTIYPLHLEEVVAKSSIKMHIQAVQYWLTTRKDYLPKEFPSGLNIDYYVTEDGSVYNDTGENIVPKTNDNKAIKIAYFGNNEDLSEKALEMVNVLAGNIDLITNAEKTDPTTTKTKAVVTGAKIKVIETGTGWLRVRAGAGLGFDEVAKLDVGKEYKLLEDKGDWVQVQVDDKVTGWVSSTYVEKT